MLTFFKDNKLYFFSLELITSCFKACLLFFPTGVLVNLHHSPSLEDHNDSAQINELGTKSDRNPSHHESVCGFINIDSVQQVVAAKWAVDVINNQSLPNELKIGKIKFLKNHS